MMHKGPIVAVDFDGTIVDHRYPDIGSPVPMACECLRDLVKAGWRVILWTMRSGSQLDEAVAYLRSHGVTLWGVNENPDQKGWTESPKVYANYYVDDAAVGCPLARIDGFSRLAVDWRVVGPALKASDGGPVDLSCALPVDSRGRPVRKPRKRLR